MRAVLPGLVIAAWTVSCGAPPHRERLEMVPIGSAAPASSSPEAKTDAKPETRTEAKPSDPPATLSVEDKTGECSGARFDNLYLTLTNDACKVDPKNEPNQDLKNDLEIRVNPSALQIAPGGKVDLLVLFKNKSAHTMPLFFAMDPVPRFEVDALDKKGRPAGLPPGKAPRQPNRATKTFARVFLAAGGVAKMKVSWTASNMRWAPELLKGGPIPDLGFPKAPAKPLARGRYTVRVLTPLAFVTDSDKDLIQPKIGIEVGE